MSDIRELKKILAAAGVAMADTKQKSIIAGLDQWEQEYLERSIIVIQSNRITVSLDHFYLRVSLPDKTVEVLKDGKWIDVHCQYNDLAVHHLAVAMAQVEALISAISFHTASNHA